MEIQGDNYTQVRIASAPSRIQRLQYESEIITHKSGLRPHHPEYRGCSTSLLILWETGEETWEPFERKDTKTGIFDQDPVTVALYAVKHGLIGQPGWSQPLLQKYAKTPKRILRLANQAKLHSFWNKPKFMFGVQIPRNHAEAMELDAQNGNTRWRDAELVELEQIDEYQTFTDKGQGYRLDKEYKPINVHMVYACKANGRHKARLVAGGHLTDTPIDSVYSSVVSLRGIRIFAFLAKLNGLETWSTDVGNAYLKSYTKEKVYNVAGPEFGEQQGHILIITKALYGLKSSGFRWRERFCDVLKQMGFQSSRAEPDIWMRDKGDH
jgi:Reverse transcriptase (RNA-dependent DNA polymerase)